MFNFMFSLVYIREEPIISSHFHLLLAEVPTLSAGAQVAERGLSQGRHHRGQFQVLRCHAVIFVD